MIRSCEALGFSFTMMSTQVVVELLMATVVLLWRYTADSRLVLAEQVELEPSSAASGLMTSLPGVRVHLDAVSSMNLRSLGAKPGRSSIALIERLMLLSTFNFMSACLPQMASTVP